jgi:hypothetical protein
VIFAQEYVAPANFGPWVECAFYSVALIGALIFTFRQIFPKADNELPQPLVVSPQASYADKQETEHRFKQVESKIEAARLENKTEMEKLRLEAVDGRRGLHKDIERNADRITDKFTEFAIEITNSVGELRGAVRELGK